MPRRRLPVPAPHPRRDPATIDVPPDLIPTVRNALLQRAKDCDIGEPVKAARIRELAYQLDGGYRPVKLIK